MSLHQQKATKSNGEVREPFLTEMVEQSNLLSFTVYMEERTNGKEKLSVLLASREPATFSRQHCDEMSQTAHSI